MSKHKELEYRVMVWEFVGQRVKRCVGVYSEVGNAVHHKNLLTECDNVGECTAWVEVGEVTR